MFTILDISKTHLNLEALYIVRPLLDPYKTRELYWYKDAAEENGILIDIISELDILLLA